MFDTQKIRKFLQTPHKITITMHHNPDADALGSSLALGHYLKKFGQEVTLVSPSAYPDFLAWMPGIEEVVVLDDTTLSRCSKIIGDSDIVFCLDFSTYNRLKGLEDCVKSCSAHIFVIDHHLNPEIKADFQLWSTEASSTAELVYQFIDLMGDLDKIDIPTGECMYAGIVTDTSSFKHPNTTPNVHRIAAKLMELGVNANRVQRLIYDNNSPSRMRLLGYSLLEKLVILPEYRTAYFTLSQADLQKFENKLGDTEGLVNYALSIQGIFLAAIIIEKTDQVKLSFRSIGDFSVNELAAQHFLGGGHKNAAGGSSSLDLKGTEEQFLQLLPHYKKSLWEASL